MFFFTSGSSSLCSSAGGGGGLQLGAAAAAAAATAALAGGGGGVTVSSAGGNSCGAATPPHLMHAPAAGGGGGGLDLLLQLALQRLLLLRPPSSPPFFLLLLPPLLLYVCYRWWRHHPRYGRNVGPPVYPVLGSLPAMLRNRERFLDWTTDALRAAAPAGRHAVRNVMPLGGPEFLDAAHPAAVEHVASRRFGSVYVKGPEVHAVFRDLLGDGIFNVDGEMWRAQRRVVAHEFAGSGVRDLFLERADAEVRDRLVPLLVAAVAGAGPGGGEGRTVVDLQDVFVRFGFDNMCQVALGMDPACLCPDLPDVPFERAFNDAALACVERFYYAAPVLWKIKRALNVGSERRFRDARKVVDDYAFSVIRARRAQLLLLQQQQRQQGGGGGGGAGEEEVAEEEGHQQQPPPPPPPDLLSRYMMSESNYSDAFLRDVVVSYMIAGKDSTPSVLAWFFCLLWDHPHVERACLAEIQAVLDARRRRGGAAPQHPPASTTSSPSSPTSSFTFEELRGMHYLHAALSEVLRLYPTAPASMRCAAAADQLPDGTRVRKGARVAYNSYAMGRMPGVWGADCLEFRPDRWLGPDGAFRPESPYKFTAFHAGPRMCPGRDVAYLQMKLVVAALLPRFRFVRAPGYVPRPEFALVMRLKGGLPVTVQLRREHGDGVSVGGRVCCAEQSSSGGGALEQGEQQH